MKNDRLLFDGDFTLRFVVRLRAANIEARHVGELGLDRSSDDEVYAWAEAHGYHWLTRYAAQCFDPEDGKFRPLQSDVNPERIDFEATMLELWSRMAREDPEHFALPNDLHL